MNIEIKQGRFVNVVATVNKTKSEADIAYVNPSAISTEIEIGSPDTNLSFRVEDKEGRLLSEYPCIARFSACDNIPEEDAIGLIQIDIPYQPEMTCIRLMKRNTELARYMPPLEATTEPNIGALGFAPGGSKRNLTGLESVKPEKGVTYSIAVKPKNEKNWNVIYIGIEKPTIKVDRNQFPDSKAVDVRVIRSIGFSDQTIVEQSLQFD